jgi:hypothetical protein
MEVNAATWEKWRRYSAFCMEHLDKLKDWEVSSMEEIVEMLDMNPPRELSRKRSTALEEVYHRLRNEIG